MNPLQQINTDSQYQAPSKPREAPSGLPPGAPSSQTKLVGLDNRSIGNNCGVGAQSPVSNPSFQRFVHEIPKNSDRRQRKAKLVEKLKLSSFPGARAEATKISQCHIRVYSNGRAGGMTVLGRQCRSRWCPLCSVKMRRERRRGLDESLRIIRDVYPRIKMFALTLTQDPKKINFGGKDCATTRRTLQKRFRKFQQSAWFRNNVEGCYFTYEATKKNETWNWHIHLILLTYQTQQETTRSVKEKWSKNGFSKIKKFNENRKGSKALEFVKYVVKDMELDGDELGNVIQATYKRRLNGATGILRAMLASLKAGRERATKRLEAQPVPAPPKAYDELTGEVFQLPEGLYYPEELLARFIGKGCKSSMFALRLYHYRMKWHRKWEEQYQERLAQGKEVFSLLQAKQKLGYWVDTSGIAWGSGATSHILMAQ